MPCYSRTLKAFLFYFNSVFQKAFKFAETDEIPNYNLSKTNKILKNLKTDDIDKY